MRTILLRQDLVALVNQIGRTLILPFSRVEDDSIARRPPLLERNAAIGKGRVHGPRRSMMSLRKASPAGRPQLWRRRARGDSGAAMVACAAAMPLIVFAVAVAADYANVARFTTRVQHAADAAAAAVSRTIARNPNVHGR